jgi:hypothetical protein
VPGHCGIPSNKEADKLARQASAMPLLGPEPPLGIPRCSAREAIKNWTLKEKFKQITLNVRHDLKCGNS